MLSRLCCRAAPLRGVHISGAYQLAFLHWKTIALQPNEERVYSLVARKDLAIQAIMHSVQRKRKVVESKGAVSLCFSLWKAAAEQPPITVNKGRGRVFSMQELRKSKIFYMCNDLTSRALKFALKEIQSFS